MAQRGYRLTATVWLAVFGVGVCVLSGCDNRPGPRVRGSVGLIDDGPQRLRKPAEGRLVKFPEDKDLPYNRLGVFIGIDKYAHLSQEELDGSVNDAEAMRRLFADRFGFKRTALVTDSKATRQGILETLEALVEQVRTARSKRKPDETVSVVIYYAGHGSQVRDQATGELGKDEDDGWDETWVAHDSSLRGDRDVRDDEIGAVYRELIRLGAEVVLVSDSCHSGTVHRSAKFAKTRRIHRKDPGPGPPLYKFRSIGPRPASRRPDQSVVPSSVVEGAPLPGLIAYTACGPAEKASEDVDEADRPCGRFTKVLRALLPEISEETTYAALHRRILVEFEKRYRYRRQTPQFHAVAAKRGERFLKGGYPTAHAEVVPGSQKDDTLKVRMGLLHGITEGSIFHFYASLDDLGKTRNRIATGRVRSVDAETCLVRLEAKAPKLADTAKAKLDSVRMDDLSVHVAADLAPPMRRVLSELDKNQQLRLVGPKGRFTVALYHDAKEKVVRFYLPEALPDPGAAKAAQPKALREFRYRDAADGAELLSRNLLFLARAQRLMTLSRNPGDLEAAISIPRRRAKPGADKGEAGIARLRHGEEFEIRLRNNSSRPLYVTLFAFNPVAEAAKGPAPRELDILYPKPGDEIEAIGPGKDLVIKDFKATAEQPLERTAIRVLAADSDIDFSPLIVPPDRGAAGLKREMLTRSGKGRGFDSPLFRLLRDAMHGGPATRGAARRVTPQTYWATATVVFDVEKAPPR